MTNDKRRITNDKRPPFVLKYTLVFGGISAACVATACCYGGWAWGLVWPAASFGALAWGYSGAGARIFAKHANGNMSWLARIWFFPYLVLYQSIWHIANRLLLESRCHSLTEDCWIGRRPLRGDAPAEVQTIVDLTCEFSASPAGVGGRELLVAPLLDGGTASTEFLIELVSHIHQASKPVYVHCAQGHGRTGLVAALLVAEANRELTPREALEIVQRMRPGVRLNRAQWRSLELAVAQLAKSVQ